MTIKKILQGAKTGARLAAGPDAWTKAKKAAKSLATALAGILGAFILLATTLHLAGVTKPTPEDAAWCQANMHTLTPREADACRYLVKRVEANK